MSSSSLKYSNKTDSFESLLPTVTISHHSLSVLQTVSSVCTELMKVSFCYLSHTGVSMCRSPKENTSYEFVLISPPVLSMSCSSYLDKW